MLLVVGLPRALWAAPPPGDGWQRTEAGELRLHHRPQDAGIAAALLAAGPAALRGIEARTGTRAPPVIDVVLAPTFADFEAAQPGRPPSWAAGTAYAERAEVYLRTRLPHVGADPIDRVFVHELVHILVGQRFGDRPQPRWLDEGAARLFAGELTPDDHLTLSRAALGGALLPLAEITNRWPQSPGRAHLAYAQSVDFVAFVAEQGADALPTLIAALADGAELDAALLRSTGKDLRGLEREWRGQLTFWHALIPVLGGSGVTWGFGTLVFVVAGWRRRRAFQRQVTAMGQREAWTPAFSPAASFESTPTEHPGAWTETVVYVDGPARVAPGDPEE